MQHGWHKSVPGQRGCGISFFNGLKKLVKTTSIPVIGPSVWDFSDIEKLRKLGAKAVSFGSVFLKYPWRPTMFVHKLAPNH